MDFEKLDFTYVDKKYRPIPFWSLNDRLTPSDTIEYIKAFDDAHIGGFFLHARGGLETPYMGEEWLSNIDAAAKEGADRSMAPYAYDENGWPSGFADGLVPASGEKYMLKSLLCEEGEKDSENTVANVNGLHFYLDINPFYSDLLNPEVTDRFIDLAYRPYTEKINHPLAGFFTDEPQLARAVGIPWSKILPDEFKKAYGFDLIPHLPSLFSDTEDIKTDKDIRVKYWRLVTLLFRRGFAERIHNFCSRHDLKLTGHYVLEEYLESQIISNGAVMPQYEYFDIPGIDMLTMNKIPGISKIAPYQVSSVAHQMGKKQIITESFAACGHGADFDDLKAIFSWQAVRGVTLLCHHLSPYSLRGLRKRDYPPAIGPQQPWWKYFHIFNDAVARIGAFLSEGELSFDVLVLHPMTSCWASFNHRGCAAIGEIQVRFTEILRELEAKHILFDLGDEIILSERAEVKDGRIKVGKASYNTLVVPFSDSLLDSTEGLIAEFKKCGGRVVSSPSELEANPITDNPNITYTERKFDNFNFLYFVNSTEEEQKAFVTRGNLIMDIATGETAPFDGKLTLCPFESAVIIESGERTASPLAEKKKKYLDLGGLWDVAECSPNAITLDKCAYNFGGKTEPETYVLNVFARAIRDKAGKTECTFRFNVKSVPEKLYLGAETPEKLEISVNGSPVKKDSVGVFFDKSVFLFDISDKVKEGENIISILTDLTQSEEVYEKIKKSEVFESEKNNLKYDTELESIYLTGPFGVFSDGFSDVSEKIVRCPDNFKIGAAPKQITLSHIEQQGFLFFAGTMTVKKTVTVTDTDLYFKMKKHGITSVILKVNGKEVKNFLWEPYEADLSEYLKKGENEIELTLTNSLRNLLGPHHLLDTNETCISPQSFQEEKNPFLSSDKERTKDYNFLNTGII